MLGTQSRRRPAGVLAGGALLLAAAWLGGPAGQPPLYDSAGPGEAYRYCEPPPGFTSQKPPAQVDHNVAPLNGQSPPISDGTAELPPQAQLLAPANALLIPPHTVTIRVAILCAPPPPLLPSDGRLDGNVYNFLATASGTPVTIQPGQQVTVVLRGPAGAPSPVMELFASGQWMKLSTQTLGNAPDSYAANVTVLGEVALVIPNSVVAVEPTTDHTGLILALTVVAVAVFAAGTVLALRGRSPRRG